MPLKKKILSYFFDVDERLKSLYISIEQSEKTKILNQVDCIVIVTPRSDPPFVVRESHSDEDIAVKDALIRARTQLLSINTISVATAIAS